MNEMPFGSAYVRRCFQCRAKKADCWNCRGKTLIHGHHIGEFNEGTEVLELPTLSGWTVVKHRRDGTTLLRSVVNGREQQWNSNANSLWILPENRDQAVSLLKAYS